MIDWNCGIQFPAHFLQGRQKDEEMSTAPLWTLCLEGKLQGNRNHMNLRLSIS